MSLVAGGAMLHIELCLDPLWTHDKVNAHIAIGFVLLPWQLAHVISVIADQQPGECSNQGDINSDSPRRYLG